LSLKIHYFRHEARRSCGKSLPWNNYTTFIFQVQEDEGTLLYFYKNNMYKNTDNGFVTGFNTLLKPSYVLIYQTWDQN